MRICYLGWADHVHLERWATQFARMGHHVSIVSVSGLGHYPPCVRQYRLGRVPWSHRARLMYLRYLLWRIKPDVVHVHWATFAEMLEGIWSGSVVITVWGSDIYRLDGMPDGTREALIRALRRAAIVTCDSEDLADGIRTIGGLPEGAVEVVQWGVDTDAFRPADGEVPLAKALGVRGDLVVLSPRAFTPLYNLVTVIEAFWRVREEFPAVRLVMKRYAADPEYEREVMSRIRELGLEGEVTVVGRVDYEKMPELYQLATLMVSVPNSDGTPMSLLEGMAVGCVPIVSDLPSLREWVRPGENGYLVPVGDATALAAAIGRVLREPDRVPALARANREVVVRLASQQAHMSRMEKLMQERLAAL